MLHQQPRDEFKARCSSSILLPCQLRSSGALSTDAAPTGSRGGFNAEAQAVAGPDEKQEAHS